MRKVSLKPLFLNIALATILIFLTILAFEVLMQDRFFPRVYVGDTHLFFLNKDQGVRVLEAKFAKRSNEKLEFVFKDQAFAVDLASASAKLDANQALNKAFAPGHEGSAYKRFLDQIKLFIFGANFTPDVQILVDEQIEAIAKQIVRAPKDATLSIDEAQDATNSSRIKISKGEEGIELDKEILITMLKDFLTLGKLKVAIPVKIVDPTITNQEAIIAKSYLDDLGTQAINLTFEDSEFTIDTQILITLLDFDQKEGSLISREKLNIFLIELSKKIDREVVEAQFSFDSSSGRVSAFKPAQEGRKLSVEKTKELILLALSGKRPKNISLPVSVTEPKIKTDQVNNLGIKELLGRGISRFSGSIPNRIYNLSLAASRINGVLIPPGEIFSFNDKVGDISAESGYKQAYIIKSGRTVLDDGGGVCQDSTTLFRAVLNAGLPVVARTAHAYRVGYYEQGFPPGLDATVFAPSVDFKFKNDTPAHILIQSYVSGVTLYVDIYGSNDGRVATLSKPAVSNQTPPLPEVRQDDPTLPKGTIKQVDFPAWGANVSFTRMVKRGGEVLISENYRSNYRPWAPVFLVGTKEE